MNNVNLIIVSTDSEQDKAALMAIKAADLKAKRKQRRKNKTQ